MEQQLESDGEPDGMYSDADEFLASVTPIAPRSTQVTPVPRYGVRRGPRHSQTTDSVDSLGGTPVSSAGYAGYGLGSTGGLNRMDEDPLRAAEADVRGAAAFHC